MDQQSAQELALYLAGRGSASGPEAARALGISQPSFSRLVKTMRPNLLITGRARAVRYAAYRDIPGIGRTVPIYAIDTTRQATQIGTLHALRSNGFFFEASTDDFDSAFFEDLPYFLHDLRPSGFLGRMIPRRHPDLGLPENIQHWTSNQCLSYLAKYGWNLPGNLIIGEEAFRLYVKNSAIPEAPISLQDRATIYPQLADNVLSSGDPGSSAAGEQPKFIATKGRERIEVIVKFSPSLTNPVSRRVGDLLIAEHIAHQTLAAHDHNSVTSEIIETSDRVFLEMERFDRTPQGGRHGVISLFPLDAQFVGSLQSWSATARSLLVQEHIADDVYDEIFWREAFGHLIANTDMHSGNLAFFTRGRRLLDVAPTYDMLPMLYAPQQSTIVQRNFIPLTPSPEHGSIWTSVVDAALEFWTAVASDQRISTDFRYVASGNRSVLEGSRHLASFLPVRRGASP